jgi:dihydrodipicolinate synthase/N-acetylneuraminate lyase
MPCGTTGEGPLLAADEVDAVVTATVEAADGSVRCSHTSAVRRRTRRPSSPGAR